MPGWMFSEPSIAWFTLVGATAILTRIRYGLAVQVGVLLIGVGVLVGGYRIVSVPLPKEIGLPSAAQVFDREGRLIGTYSKVRRFIIETDELPNFVTEAVIAAEDHDYFSHHGFSPRAMVRALWSNVTSLGIREGGSTVTQQYVKNALLQDRSRTITRKLKEAVLAVKLEDRHSKKQILSFYLNTIYFGRGAYGIEAASRSYFDKHATALTVNEAAYLAGIIRAPEAYQADEHPGRARVRRDAVLEDMADLGYIGAGRADRIMARPVVFASGVEQRSRHVRAAYFMEWLRREYLYPRFGECLYTCGLKIHTTLDLDLQRSAERAVDDALDRPDDPEAALVALTPAGEVRAFVGGRAFSDAVAASGFNYASDLPGRQAGSALKPFTLLAAIEQGMSAGDVIQGSSPATIRSDACGDRRSKDWTVSNYDAVSYPPMTLARATAFSVNTAYARLISSVGPRSVARLVSRAGFGRHGTSGDRRIKPYCSLALGSLDVTPLEMARAYAIFQSNGVLPRVSPILYVEDDEGTCLFTSEAGEEECEEREDEATGQIASPSSVAAVDQALGDVVVSGTGRGAALDRFTAAGKTGTSQLNTDAWFAGYTGELVASVWVGHPAASDGKSVPQMRRCPRSICRPVDGDDVTGGTIPADIWASFMNEAMAKLDPEVPEGPGGPGPGPALPGHQDPGEEAVTKPSKEKGTQPEPLPSPRPSDSGGLIPIPPLPVPP